MYVYISKQFRTKLNVTFGEIPKGIVEDFFVFFCLLTYRNFRRQSKHVAWLENRRAILWGVLVLGCSCEY